MPARRKTVTPAIATHYRRSEALPPRCVCRVFWDTRTIAFKAIADGSTAPSARHSGPHPARQ
jgi:hypothetical protein